jgi:hypothetical protein
LPAHHSSKEDISFDEWMSSDYSPLWRSKKEDLEEEDVDEVYANVNTNTEDDDSDSDSNFDSPPPKRARRAWSSLLEDHIFRLSSL